jgi:hypothetical protein
MTKRRLFMSEEKIYFYVYELTYYDEYEKKEEKKKGLTFGETYKDAIEKVADYYDDSSITDIKMRITDNNTLVIEADDILNEFSSLKK